MEIPEGVELNNPKRDVNVLSLKKAMHGLRLSPKQWHLRFSEEMAELGLEKD